MPPKIPVSFLHGEPTEALLDFLREKNWALSPDDIRANMVNISHLFRENYICLKFCPGLETCQMSGLKALARQHKPGEIRLVYTECEMRPRNER